LPEYLVNSAILQSGKDPKTCAQGAAKMLAKGTIKGIQLKACYCCETENRVALLIEGPNQDTVLQVIQEHLDIPVASIMEAEQVSVIP